MDTQSSAFIASPELVRAVRRCGTPIDCSEDRELFHQGEDPSCLYVLESGCATMTLEGEGGVPLVRRTVGAGSLLGLPALMGNLPYSLTAVALAGAEVSFVTQDVFRRLMMSEPKLALMVVQVLAAEVHSARTVISESRTHRGRSLRRKDAALGLTEANR